jgi:hypothetical protein
MSLAVSKCGPQTEFSYEPATVPISYHTNIFEHSHQPQCQENPLYFNLYYHSFRESVGIIIVCHYHNRNCVRQNCALRYHCNLKFNLKARYSRTLSVTVSTLHQLNLGDIILKLSPCIINIIQFNNQLMHLFMQNAVHYKSCNC